MIERQPDRRGRSRPVAIAIGGPAGSGKTTLATALAPALGAALLDLDVATGPLTDVILNLIDVRDLSDPRASVVTREARYRTLFDLAVDTARAGTSTVLVAPFTAERDADRWADATRSLGMVADVHLVWMRLPAAQLASRLSARHAARDVLKLRDVASWTARGDDALPAAAHVALNADRSVEDLVSDVLHHLGR